MTIISDFCLWRCEYVKYDRSSDEALNEFVRDGHKIPLTTFPRLNAEYASLLNGGGGGVCGVMSEGWFSEIDFF